MANTPQHEDFGEKIGGAKKDLWQGRGLYSDDVDGMNSREADKFVKKDNVWKKSDYQALIDNGLPVEIAYFIKTVRDSLPTAPDYRRSDDTPDKRLARQKEFVDTVRQVQSVVELVKTRDDAMAAFNKCMIEPGWFEKLEPGLSRAYYASPTEKGRDNTAITDKLAKALFIRSVRDFEYRITDKAKKMQFGVAKDDKVPRGFEIRYNEGNNSWSKNNDWKPATWFVSKNRQIIEKNFDTRADALKWAQDFSKQQGINGKQRFVPKQLDHIRRDGPDYRRGKDASGQDYLDTFGFKGGEFGNWMSQNDRRASLNMGFDGLKDLADALQVSDKDISYQGALSIAFGARGSGNAMAHYEPLRQVINLTKMRGAGSLAHEWWHGLDDFMGQKFGAKGLLSENPSKHPLMKKLVDTIRYKPETLEQATERTNKETARHRRNAESWLPSAIGNSIERSGNENAAVTYESLKTAFLAGEVGIVEKMSALKKEITGRVIPKEERDRLEIFESILHDDAQRSEPVIGKVASDYLTAAKKIGEVYDKDGGYWDSDVELTARAFATYVVDKLPGDSDYLVGHAESGIAIVPDKEGNMEIVRAYPTGNERIAINAVFDELVDELKREGILTHDDRPQPEAVQEVPQDIRDVPQDFGADFWQYAPIEQLSLFSASPAKEDKPSVLGQIAASKAEIKESKAPDKQVKSHDQEL